MHGFIFLWYSCFWLLFDWFFVHVLCCLSLLLFVVLVCWCLFLFVVFYVLFCSLLLLLFVVFGCSFLVVRFWLFVVCKPARISLVLKLGLIGNSYKRPCFGMQSYYNLTRRNQENILHLPLLTISHRLQDKIKPKVNSWISNCKLFSRLLPWRKLEHCYTWTQF